MTMKGQIVYRQLVPPCAPVVDRRVTSLTEIPTIGNEVINECDCRYAVKASMNIAVTVVLSARSREPTIHSRTRCVRQCFEQLYFA